jgi:hypothetical protein
LGRLTIAWLPGGRYRWVSRQRRSGIPPLSGSPLVGTERLYPRDDQTRQRQDHDQKLRQPE